nr:LysR family transcriptional regulator [Bordetella petrii]
MQVFARVMECGSFSRAAESLNVANATVTSCVRNLEQHLGVTLIQRNTRHLHLTEEGRLFLPRCLEVLNAVLQAEADVQGSAADIAGPLRVEAPFAIGQSLLCPALVELTRRHPGLSVSMTLTNEPHNLIERATDVAVRMDRVEDADLVGRPIYEAHYVACGAPDTVAAALAAAPTPRDLNPARCLGLLQGTRQTPNPWIFTRGKEQAVVQPGGILHFNNTESLIQAAVRGAGLIYVLDIFVADLIDQGRLARLYPEWTTTVRTFYAVTVKTRYTAPKVRAFIDFLLEIFDARRRPPVKTMIPVGPGRRTKKPR